MSIVHVFAIRDAKTQAYEDPFFRVSEGVAIREFADYCQQPGNPLSKWPQDFALFHFGIFSKDEGRFVLELQPIEIISALDCLRKAAEEAQWPHGPDAPKPRADEPPGSTPSQHSPGLTPLDLSSTDPAA